MNQTLFYCIILLATGVPYITKTSEEDLRTSPKISIPDKTNDKDCFVLITTPSTQRDKENITYTEQILTASVLAAHDTENQDKQAIKGPSSYKASDSSSISSSLHSETSRSEEEHLSSAHHTFRTQTTTTISHVTRTSLSSTTGTKSKPNLPRSVSKPSYPDTKSFTRNEPPGRSQSLGEIVQFDVAEATTLAAFNIHSSPEIRHRSDVDKNQDLESQQKKSPLSSCDSLSYQNSGDSIISDDTSTQKQGGFCGLLDCFKSCWSSRKKKKT